MKQSAVKTLGVAALGAAFAAVGAGAANAAPATPDATQVAKALPGTVEALTQGQGAVASGVAAAKPAVQRVLAQGPTGLLGGLPLGSTGLPTHGMGVNGLPLG
ncbi:ATP-binding protein [Streptomyces murinus]|uniref:ATP-binding protein n=1 Tax=Streptomyces murinus TaxID=33900 RepID=UPI002E81A80F|nr:ATP-binding protein [Streptomyces murinus]WUD09009.1 ATP-binding protein [Streptomyces murinus]